MGLFAALMGGQQGQPNGYTYPGAGAPPVNTQIMPGGGAPQLPPPPAPGAGAGSMPPPMVPPSMPNGASAQPGGGNGGMFSSLANNPMLMAMMAGKMGTGTPGPTGMAQAGGGAFPPMPGANVGAPPGQAPSLVNADSALGGGAGGSGASQWLQQLLARIRGGQ